MLPFQISSSYFEPETLIPEMSSSASVSAGFASTCSDSESSVSTTSSLGSIAKVSCFYDPSTCEYRCFSIPEKIVYYIAKNCTNGETFKKLVGTCKYFFKVNPVIVIQELVCYDHAWYASYGEYDVGLKCDQPKNFKIWVTQNFTCVDGDASQMIPLIYKNDATVVIHQSDLLKFDEFLFLASNTEELSMSRQLVKYENGETVQLEDVVKNLPKLKSLIFDSCCDGNDVNCNTARKLMETEHFKNISKLEFCSVSEALDVEEMFKYIWENKHIEVELWYLENISDECKELIRKYSNRLQKEEGCNSTIRFYGMDYGTLNELFTSSSDDDHSDTAFDSSDSDDEKEELLFPWNNEDEEEWELPWDKIE